METLLPVLVVVAVFALRLRRMGRSRPLQHQRLWILPAVVLVAVGAALIIHPPALYGWLALLGGLVLGAPLGWQRGRFTHIERDDETGALMMRQSWAALLLFGAVLALRQFARMEVMDGDAGASATGVAGAAHGLRLMLLSDGLMGFALGLIGMQRLEMWLRARRLVAAAPATTQPVG